MQRVYLIFALLISSWSMAQEIPFDAGPSDRANTNAPASKDIMQETQNYPTQPLEPKPTRAKTTSSAKKANTSTNDLSKLGKLEAFSDIAVINRRYLPKTSRFEVSPNAGYIINDSFFSNMVVGARGAYYFTEEYGVEASYLSINSSTKDVLNNLATARNVAAASLATPTGFFGAAFKWAPIYGKMTLMNKTIVPYDTYFLAGGGMTQTNQSTTAPTVQVGAGQLYAIKKWWAFRWDFNLFMFATQSNLTGASGTYSNLHLTLGMSFFFPGATYR